MKAETFKLDIKTTVKSTETLYKGTTPKIQINKYWDSHGTKIDWGTETIPGGEVEIKKVITTWEFSSGPQDFEYWHLYLNGVRVENRGDVVGYRVLKTKMVLTNCIGAG